jgi:hypothetical protein
MDPVPPPFPNSPPSGTGARPITSVRQTLVLGAISLILLAQLVWVAPLLEPSFRQVKGGLPALTELTFATSRFARENVLAWGIFIAIPLLVPMLTTAMIWRPGISHVQLRLRQLVLGSLVTMVFALIAVTFVIGLFLGYIAMINSYMTPGR